LGGAHRDRGRKIKLDWVNSQKGNRLRTEEKALMGGLFEEKYKGEKKRAPLRKATQKRVIEPRREELRRGPALELQ